MIERPVLSNGKQGSQVALLQGTLGIFIDGDFGDATENAVEDFQRSHQISVDGEVGRQTWTELDRVYSLPPYPPPLPANLTNAQIGEIATMAMGSQAASYSWRDRGVMPDGYTKGMAVTWANVYRRYLDGDPIQAEMAQAATGNPDKDALTYYKDVFEDEEMPIDQDGIDTLRALWTLLWGLGPRESSGKHCCGRDQSASNTDGMTCEAGLFQTSWNASSCSTDMEVLFDQYSLGPPQCALNIFQEDVSCSSSDWKSYGSGQGYEYQELAKHCPAFHAEITALALRKLRKHWGPINEMKAEVQGFVNDLLLDIQQYIDEEYPDMPERPERPERPPQRPPVEPPAPVEQPVLVMDVQSQTPVQLRIRVGRNVAVTVI